MIEILLISILVLAALTYAGVWVWTVRHERKLFAERARLTIERWEAEQHRQFNEEFLDSLADEDRERFLSMWKGEG